jgi:hypothetical protein
MGLGSFLRCISKPRRNHRASNIRTPLPTPGIAFEAQELPMNNTGYDSGFFDWGTWNYRVMNGDEESWIHETFRDYKVLALLQYGCFIGTECKRIPPFRERPLTVGWMFAIFPREGEPFGHKFMGERRGDDSSWFNYLKKLLAMINQVPYTFRHKPTPRQLHRSRAAVPDPDPTRIEDTVDRLARMRMGLESAKKRNRADGPRKVY